MDVWPLLIVRGKWVVNGEPVWDASTTYATNSVVKARWLFHAVHCGIPGPSDEPDTDPEWELVVHRRAPRHNSMRRP